MTKPVTVDQWNWIKSNALTLNSSDQSLYASCTHPHHGKQTKECIWFSFSCRLKKETLHIFFWGLNWPQGEPGVFPKRKSEATQATLWNLMGRCYRMLTFNNEINLRRPKCCNKLSMPSWANVSMWPHLCLLFEQSHCCYIYILLQPFIQLYTRRFWV